MAYMSQERKSSKAPVIKAILAKYGFKGSLAVRHHSTLILNIKSGPLDMIGNYNAVMHERDLGKPEHMKAHVASGSMNINPYWYREHFTGKPLEFLTEVVAAMNAGNHDRSDIMTDYFDVGWYIEVNFGQWDKPYELVVPGYTSRGAKLLQAVTAEVIARNPDAVVVGVES